MSDTRLKEIYDRVDNLIKQLRSSGRDDDSKNLYEAKHYNYTASEILYEVLLALEKIEATNSKLNIRDLEVVKLKQDIKKIMHS
ncbi:MAG: hypothetical protein KDD45_03105 [Bdellovibrionales bacterium]|nr:hypothetical protein [Bdellovibrionales bacterium]